MQEKFTLIENEQLISLELSKKMLAIYPKARTLNFIEQFAYAYHTEKGLPAPLAAMILN